jgi:hypothetical protein
MFHVKFESGWLKIGHNVSSVNVHLSDDEARMVVEEIQRNLTPAASDPATPCPYCGFSQLFPVCSVCREPVTPGA